MPFAAVPLVFGAAGLLLPGQEAVEGSCGRQAVGLGPGPARREAKYSLSQCGVAFVEGAFPQVAEEVFASAVREFLARPDIDGYRHGPIRRNRTQFHLPFEPPFDELSLLGAGGILGPVLTETLGEAFVLDLATIVVVPPHAGAQEAHRDRPIEGSVAVHVPLHKLEAHHAPLGMCGGTHVMNASVQNDVFHHAFMYNEPNETFDDCLKRLLCGGQRRFQEVSVEVTADECELLKVKSGLIGGEISGFHEPQAESLPWRKGDQVIEMNGTRVHDADSYWAALDQQGDGPLKLRLERPLPAKSEDLTRFMLGAPLQPGDALTYDSRLFHWGTANSEDSARHVMYLNFKNSTNHPGVHPLDVPKPKVRQALEAFRSRLLALRGAAELEHPDL